MTSSAGVDMGREALFPGVFTHAHLPIITYTEDKSGISNLFNCCYKMPSTG